MEPDKEFQHNLEIILYGDLAMGLGRLLLRSFRERDDAYRKEVLESIDKILDHYDKTWFDNPTIRERIDKIVSDQ